MAHGPGRPVRTQDDLRRAVCAIARHFSSDAVVVIGSQAILGHLEQPPVAMVTSMEIDAYPENAPAWQQTHKTEASEEINGLFGYLSSFHETHGFYVDGVDEGTARFPRDWRARAVERVFICDGLHVVARFPALNDLVISKLCRLDERDRQWIGALHALRPINPDEISALLNQVPDLEPEIAARARLFLSQIP